MTPSQGEYPPHRPQMMRMRIMSGDASGKPTMAHAPQSTYDMPMVTSNPYALPTITPNGNMSPPPSYLSAMTPTNDRNHQLTLLGSQTQSKAMTAMPMTLAKLLSIARHDVPA
jgi:hypothetical protein